MSWPKTPEQHGHAKRATPPLTFPRADPKALKAFDPRTKICVMNCGPHNLDPRDDKERKFLCDDCYINDDPERRHHAPHT